MRCGFRQIFCRPSGGVQCGPENGSRSTRAAGSGVPTSGKSQGARVRSNLPQRLSCSTVPESPIDVGAWRAVSWGICRFGISDSGRSCQLFGRGQFVADSAFHDFTQGGVLGGELFQRFDQRSRAAPELLHTAGNDVNQYVGIVDDLKGGFQIFVSHGGSGSGCEDSGKLTRARMPMFVRLRRLRKCICKSDGDLSARLPAEPVCCAAKRLGTKISLNRTTQESVCFVRPIAFWGARAGGAGRPLSLAQRDVSGLRSIRSMSRHKDESRKGRRAPWQGGLHTR